MGSELTPALNTIGYLSHAKLKPVRLLFEQNEVANANDALTLTLTIHILSCQVDPANSREFALWTARPSFVKANKLAKCGNMWRNVRVTAHNTLQEAFSDRNIWQSLSKSTRGDGSPSVKADNTVCIWTCSRVKDEPVHDPELP